MFYHDDIADDFDVLIVLVAFYSDFFVIKLAGRLLSRDEG